MSVYRSETLVGNLDIFMWQSTAAGDEVTNSAGITFLHPTVLAVGKVRIEIDGQDPTEHQARKVIILPIGVGYKFVILEPGFLFCIYNLLEPGALEEVQMLRGGGLKLWKE